VYLRNYKGLYWPTLIDSLLVIEDEEENDDEVKEDFLFLIVVN